MDEGLAKRIQDLESLVKKQDEEIKSLQLANQLMAANLGIIEGHSENAASQSECGSVGIPRQSNYDYQIRQDEIRSSPTTDVNKNRQVVNDVDGNIVKGKQKESSFWSWNPLSSRQKREREEKRKEEIRRETEAQMERLRLENKRELEKLKREAAEKQLKAQEEDKRRQRQMDEDMKLKRMEAKVAEERRRKEQEKQEKLNQEEMQRHQMDVERKKQDLLKHKQRLKEEEEREKARIQEEKKRRMETLKMILNHENNISNLNDWCGQPD